MELIDRARRYVGKMDASVSGAGGHNAAYAAAIAVVKGFDLPEGLAMQVLQEEFNSRCAPAWSEKELKHKLRQAEKANAERGYLLKNDKATWTAAAGHSRPHAAQQPAEAHAPEAVKKGQDVDPAMIAAMTLRGFEMTERFLMERSPIDVRYVDTPELFLGHLYEPGEKALIFTSEYSQGDFGFFAAGGSEWPGTAWRLGGRPGVRPTEEALPRSGRCGVWFLANPVDGKWKPNGDRDENGEPVISRRSGPNVTVWRYLLLESDSVADATWLNLLGQLPLPIAALYTSGKRSIHALLRVEAKTQNEIQQMAEMLGPVLAKLGGDWKAMTSVRLTRLPLCLREGAMVTDGKTPAGKPKSRYVRWPEPGEQRLLWLDQEPTADSILTKPRLRVLDAE